MRRIVITTLAALVLMSLAPTLVQAQSARRAVAMISGGPADVSAHAVNLWGPRSATNVYLGEAGDPAIATIRPPDGPLLLVEGCTLRRSTWDVIQRLNPNGVIGVGRICPQVVQQAAGESFPEQRYRPVWDAVAQCESGGRWNLNTGNGYYGGLQFSLSSWRYVGGAGYPHQHDKYEQIRRAELLIQTPPYERHWPVCGPRAGLTRP